jgi:DNA-binding transcriptional ArsR family regulator
MEKQTVIGALAALAQETRLDVFRLLVRAGPEGLPAGEMAAALGIPSATLSFHLKELRNAGIVCCQREGRSKIYSPDFGAVRELLAYLSQHCCEGGASRRGARSKTDGTTHTHTASPASGSSTRPWSGRRRSRR